MPLSNFNKIRSRSHFHTVWFGSKITVYFFLPTTHLDAHLFIRWSYNVLLPKVHCPSGHWCGVFHRDRVLTMYFGIANVTLDAEGAASWNKSNISAFLVNTSKSGGGCQQPLVEFINKSWNIHMTREMLNLALCGIFLLTFCTSMKSDTRTFHFAWKMNNKLLIFQSYGNLFYYKETWTFAPVRGVKFPFFLDVSRGIFSFGRYFVGCVQQSIELSL